MLPKLVWIRRKKLKFRLRKRRQKRENFALMLHVENVIMETTVCTFTENCAISVVKQFYFRAMKNNKKNIRR